MHSLITQISRFYYIIGDEDMDYQKRKIETRIQKIKISGYTGEYIFEKLNQQVNSMNRSCWINGLVIVPK